MSLISVIVTLAIIGAILYLIDKYLPVDSKIKTIINWVAAISVIVWLLYGFGVLGSGNLEDIKLPKIK